MKHFTQGILIGLLALAASAAEAPNASYFQLRLVLDGPSPNSETLPFTIREGQRVMLDVDKTPFLDLTAVQSATAVKDAFGVPFSVKVMLTPEGRQRLSEVTGKNIGNRIAVIVDGRIFNAPVVQAQLTTDSIPVIGNFTTEQQAVEVAEKIESALHSK